MKRWALFAIGALLTGFATAQPVITSLSADSLPRSGRLRIFGTNFGTTRGNSRVLIGGLSAWITRWSDTAITAYVPVAGAVRLWQQWKRSARGCEQ